MIDLHAHIDLYPDPRTIVEGIEKRNMYVLSVTTTPSAWAGTYSLAKHYPRIKTALGLHPQIAHERVSELELFDTFINETCYVGEVGLDGADEYVHHRECQVRVLKHILNSCSDAGGKIISLHSRRAANEVIDTLSEYPNAGIPIFHWFTGGKRELQKAIQMDAWFSVGPAMLKSKKSREMIQLIPQNRILTESDGPFAKVLGESVMPWDVESAIMELSKLWSVSVAEANAILYANFRSLVALK